MMGKRRSMYIMDKRVKTAVIIGNDNIRKYIPVTKNLTLTNLISLMEQFRMVYIKPTSRFGGFGVMRATVSGNKAKKQYHLQTKTRKKAFSTIRSLYNYIVKIKPKSPYLAQQGIRLLKYRGRIFDIRVMVQKNKKGNWDVTGIVGRLAKPKKVVTNYHSGGTPLPANKLLRPHMKGEELTEQIEEMKALSLEIANEVNKKYPRINMIGVDLGLDRSFKPWIIEYNTRPDPYIFRALKDKSMFRRVYRYAVKLGHIKIKRRKKRAQKR